MSLNKLDQFNRDDTKYKNKRKLSISPTKRSLQKEQIKAFIDYCNKMDLFLKRACQIPIKTQNASIYRATAKVIKIQQQKKLGYSLQSESILKRNRPGSINRYITCFTQLHKDKKLNNSNKSILKVVNKSQQPKQKQPKGYLKIYQKYIKSKKDSSFYEYSSKFQQLQETQNFYQKYYQQLIKKGKKCFEEKLKNQNTNNTKVQNSDNNKKHESNYKDQFEKQILILPQKIENNTQQNIIRHSQKKYLKNNPINIKFSLSSRKSNHFKKSKFQKQQQKIIDQVTKNKLSQQNSSALIQRLNQTFATFSPKTKSHRYNSTN